MLSINISGPLVRSLGFCSLGIMASCSQQYDDIVPPKIPDTVNSRSPNILLILSDDQAWSQVSGQMHPDIPESGSQYLETPNIDRLGDKGMRFTNGYAPGSVCTPSRRSILTGSTVARSGTEFRSPFVPAEHMTIPRTLKQINPAYLCAHFGKWGENMISSPEECGYDASDGHTGNNTGGMPRSLGVSGGHMDGPPYFIDNEDPKRTFSVTNSAVEFMRHAVKENRPFFVQVSYYAVHLSIVCRQETLLKYEMKGEPDRGYPQAWAAMLDDMDQGVGLLLEALYELGVDSNTYVFFMSDNGGQENPMPGKNEQSLRLNHPLSGSKQSLLEGGIRVPFMVRGPGVTPESYSHVPVVGYDLMSTFYDLAGGTGSITGDGGSIRPLFNDPVNGLVNRPKDGLIFHRPGYLSSAIRQGSYKLFITWDPEGRIASRNLYNLDADVVENEMTDIIGLNTGKADQMQKILLDYLLSVNAEDPVTIIDYLPNNRGVRPPPVQ